MRLFFIALILTVGLHHADPLIAGPLSQHHASECATCDATPMDTVAAACLAVLGLAVGSPRIRRLIGGVFQPALRGPEAAGGAIRQGAGRAPPLRYVPSLLYVSVLRR